MNNNDYQSNLYDDKTLDIKSTGTNFNKCQQTYQMACLREHNRYRAMHHVPSLRSNKKLQRIAQNYAQYLSDNNIFEHSKANGIGENLAYSWSSKAKQLRDCSGIKIIIRFN